MKTAGVLICDSGSTKADWAYFEHKQCLFRFQTIGLNPFYHSRKSFIFELDRLKFYLEDKVPKQVYFYGSGCASAKNAGKVRKWLQVVFSFSHINVYSDLLAAGRALFQNNSGLAIISGTGSGAAFYNINKITTIMPGLGFILGDEGSGAYFGKKLVSGYLQGILPHEISASFDNEFGLQRHQIIENVYYKPFPNRYLAGFTPFLSKHSGHKWVQNFLEDGFGYLASNIKQNFKSEELMHIGCCGTVGYMFRNEMYRAFKKYGLEVNVFMQHPIDALIEYHQNGLDMS